MANHAYVVLEKKVPISKLNILLEEFMKKTLKDEFVLSPLEDVKYGWRLSHKTLEEYDLTFWVSTFDETKNSKSYPAIEFRHGHHTELMWWIDFELEVFLALKLNGKINDQGAGWWEQESLKPKTFRQYLEMSYERIKPYMLKQVVKFLQMICRMGGSKAERQLYEKFLKGE